MNFNYHIHKSSIQCPYCDKICENDGRIRIEDMETKVEIECDHCGKNFYADACVVYNTYSDCELNGEKHDLRPSRSYPTVFNCKNCYYHEVRPEVQRCQ